MIGWYECKSIEPAGNFPGAMNVAFGLEFGKPSLFMAETMGHYMVGKMYIIMIDEVERQS